MFLRKGREGVVEVVGEDNESVSSNDSSHLSFSFLVKKIELLMCLIRKSNSYEPVGA